MPFNTLLAVQNCLTMNFVDLAMVSRAYKPVYESEAEAMDGSAQPLL